MNMSLVKEIKTDSVRFMKERNTRDLSTLRLLISELEKEKVAMKLNTVEDLTDEQAQTVISRQIKKLNKEIESYVAVGRETDSQEAEKKLLTSYLPKQATEDEIRELVYHAIALVERGEIRNPMQYLSQRLKGKADMKLVAKIAKEVEKSR